VYLPPQKIQAGRVTIVILEGRYGQVKLENASLASDQTLSYFLKDIETGSPILSSELESRLLLLADTPGVVVHSTLEPGDVLGHSDLSVQTTAGPRVNGSLDADNAGNRYTGAPRVGATLNINELAGRGDVASLRALTSGHGLHYLRGAYQAQFGKTTAGVSYSELKYALGREFVALDAHGSQKITSLYA
jgi:hemolysin activation/secretion protein